MKKLIYLILILSLTSCVTQRRCNDKFPPEQSINIKDSTRITDVTVFDTVHVTQYYKIPVYVTRDSVVVRFVNGQTVSDKLYLKGRYSEAVIWMQNNILKGTLTESGWIAIQTDLIMSKRTITELKARTTYKSTVVTEKYIPAWVKRLAWVGAIYLVLTIAIAVLTVYSKITKIKILPL